MTSPLIADSSNTSFDPPQAEEVDAVRVAVDGVHAIEIVRFRFHDGSVLPYIRVVEWHREPAAVRYFSVDTLVHLALNVGDPEVWQIGNRDHEQAAP